MMMTSEPKQHVVFIYFNSQESGDPVKVSRVVKRKTVKQNKAKKKDDLRQQLIEVKVSKQPFKNPVD